MCFYGPETGCDSRWLLPLDAARRTDYSVKIPLILSRYPGSDSPSEVIPSRFGTHHRSRPGRICHDSALTSPPPHGTSNDPVNCHTRSRVARPTFTTCRDFALTRLGFLTTPVYHAQQSTCEYRILSSLYYLSRSWTNAKLRRRNRLGSFCAKFIRRSHGVSEIEHL